MTSDDDFLQRLRLGDPAAYEELIVRFEGPLYRYFLGVCGDPQLAGEQSSDCFGELFKAMPKMSGSPDQLRAFVFGVARNVSHRRRRSQRCLASSLQETDEITCASPGPVQATESREELARLLSAIHTLDETTRDVLLLRFVDQLSLAEVAAVIDEPLGTVKSRIHRGRKRLEAILKPTPTYHA